jgi:hypothetical protein
MLRNVLGLAVLYYIAAMVAYVFVRQFSPNPIIFYQGLWVIAFVTIGFAATVTASWFVSRISIMTRDVHLAAIVMAALALYGTHVTVPSLLDRSISLYLIGLTQEGAARTIPEYQKLFHQGFIVGNGAIEKRLHEQIQSGNLVEDSGNYVLTRRGVMIYHLNQVLAKIFNTDRRYVAPDIRKE